MKHGHAGKPEMRSGMAIACAALVCLFLAVPAAGAQESTPSPTEPADSSELTELERQKLEEEVRQLRIENSRLGGATGWFLAIGPTLTTLVAVATLGLTFFKQSRDLASAQESAKREADRWHQEFQAQQAQNSQLADQWRAEFVQQQDSARHEREKERIQRFDDRLAQVVENVGSQNLSVRLNAAAELGLFLRPEYSSLQPDLLGIVIANLKAHPEPVVADVLRRHLSRLLRSLLEGQQFDTTSIGDRLDLTRLDLYRLNLRGLQFPDSVGLDLAFTTLTHADLSEVRMFRALGGEATLDAARFSRSFMNEARFNKAIARDAPVHFHGASLVSATFDDASLPRADFRMARLQGASLQNADLRFARFEGANLADASLLGATLDNAALRSIALGAKRWRDARMDEELRQRLDEFSRRGARDEASHSG